MAESARAHTVVWTAYGFMHIHKRTGTRMSVAVTAGHCSRVVAGYKF